MPIHQANHVVRWTNAALIATVMLSIGCSREWYVSKANEEVEKLIAEKSSDPRWRFCDFNIDIDPRSRYYDPLDMINPPMPEDDPASHEYMHCIDGKKAYSLWDSWGHRWELENPTWREQLGQYVELTPDQAVRLSLDNSVRLALIHSPDYQQSLEEIYLSALDVSTERFRFDVQFFGGNVTEAEHLGRLRRPTGSTNSLTTDNDFEIRKSFATAGELLVGFANGFVWQFAGENTSATASLLNFSLVQPLLRAGGREIALETLTIAERDLLGNLRAMQRFRQGFYTNIAVGDNQGVQGPRRQGGFQGGTGLTGFTGTGGGFGGVGQATGFGRGGGGGAGGGAAIGGGAGAAGGGAGAVGGFLGLLQALQELRNAEDSLAFQIRGLALLEANLEAGIIDLTQVDQFRQNVQTLEAQVLQARNGLQNQLDVFKSGTLGLSPDLPIELDTSLIAQFQFIDPQMTDLHGRIEDYLQEFGGLEGPADVMALEAALDRIFELGQQLGTQFDNIDADLVHLEERAPNRERLMTPAEIELFRHDRVDLAGELAELRRRYELISQRYEQVRAGLSPQALADVSTSIVQLLTDLSILVQELQLVQARARLEAVFFDPVEITAPQALEVARANRLDWMNNRASLVDTWRLITFNADRLQSNLDIRFSGDVGTEGNNPINFRGPTGSLRASVALDGPFTRLSERNTFRQSLIEYQRGRRQQIQFEDGVNLLLRGILRQLEENRVNLEIQREATRIAIRRVDQTREVLTEPPPPVAPGQPAATLGPTAAQNLIGALADLANAQNNFMSVWFSYYAQRMQLIRDIGIMELDENGMWIDRPLAESLAAVGGGVGCLPPVPEEWIRAMEITEEDLAPDANNAPPGGMMPNRAMLPRGGMPPQADWTNQPTARSYGQPPQGRGAYVQPGPTLSPQTPRQSTQWNQPPQALPTVPPSAINHHGGRAAPNVAPQARLMSPQAYAAGGQRQHQPLAQRPPVNTGYRAGYPY